MTQTHPNAPHIIMDVTALPSAMETATLTTEDWRLMLISLNWIHQRFSQHPENMRSIHWFSRSVDALAMLMRLHPLLVREMRQQWPTFDDLLTRHPCREGIWKSLQRMVEMEYPSTEGLNFFRRDALRPLERWMEHQAALIDVASLPITGDPDYHPTVVHSLGLPISEEHADSVQVITVQDLSLLHYDITLKHLPHAEAKREWLLKQLEFLGPHHRFVVWDYETAEVLTEFAPQLSMDQMVVAPPCWLMEMPAQLAKDEGVKNPDYLEAAFTAWCRQHGWFSPMHEVRAANRRASTGEQDEEAKENTELNDDENSDGVEVIPQARNISLNVPPFIVVSLRDEEHENFHATLSLALLGIMDALSMLPDPISMPTNPIEKLALHLIEQNGEAMASQSERKLLCLYKPGRYLQTLNAVKTHPYYAYFKDKIVLVPSTPMNKALLYPKALAFCIFPLGATFYPTVLEAMAYTLPILAPSRLSFELTAQQGGAFYQPDEVTTLPTILDELQKQETPRARGIRARARKAAETRSWQYFGRQLWKVYFPEEHHIYYEL